jgi:hypothetical protein
MATVPSDDLKAQKAQYRAAKRLSLDLIEMARPHNLLARIVADIGEFWKNPLVANDFYLIHDILPVLPKASQAVFLCLLEDWVRGYCLHPGEGAPKPVVDVIMKISTGHRSLHFKTGREWVQGEDTYIYSVVGYCSAPQPDDDASEDSEMEVVFDEVNIEDTALPKDLSTSWWWLYLESHRDKQEWYLFSYKEKKMFMGPEGVERRFAASADFTEFTSLEAATIDRPLITWS